MLDNRPALNGEETLPDVLGLARFSSEGIEERRLALLFVDLGVMVLEMLRRLLSSSADDTSCASVSSSFSKDALLS